MNIEIANRLVALRKQKGLSQEDLAEQLGISRQAVSKWERAESAPDMGNLMSLAKLYQVSLDELLQMDDEAIENERFAQDNAAQTEEPCFAPPPEPPVDEAHAYRKRVRHALNAFPYPIVASIIYLFLGFYCDLWHPGWLIFLTVPVYYAIVNMW